MQLELLNDQGQATAKFDAPETVFGRAYNEELRFEQRRVRLALIQMVARNLHHATAAW